MVKPMFRFFTLALLLLSLGSCAVKPVRDADLINGSGLSDWSERRFYSQTLYSAGYVNDRHFIKAVSEGAASVLYKYIEVDLNKTPYLNWTWCIHNTLGELDEKSKAGDDFAARIYLIVSPDAFSIKPRSINYVWSNTAEKNSIWDNPFSTQVKMVAVRSGQSGTGRWTKEKRNIKQDLKSIFNEENIAVLGIAIMTDTDNSHTSALAYYSDIYFSAD